MALTENAKGLLIAVAVAVLEKRETSLSFYSEGRSLQDSDGVATFLAQQVEERSGGSLTVRTASGIFARVAMGPNNYLVLCAANTPPGVVTEFQSGMQLFCVGPYRNGYSLEKPKAKKSE